MSNTVVLLIEDDNLLRESIVELLEAYEIIVHEAALGNIGLELARTKQPDAIILDMTLPDMDGFAVIEQLKADPLTRSIPTLVLSGIANDDIRQKALEMGAEAYMYKPFEAIELVNSILELVGEA